MMSSTRREPSTLAIILFLASVSFLVSQADALPDLRSRYALGYALGWLGLAYREIVVRRESHMGEMTFRDRDATERRYGFTLSLILRGLQVSPMIFWIGATSSPLMPILIGTLILSALALTIMESKLLWVRVNSPAVS